MYSEILADHTSLHALRPFSGGDSDLKIRTGELLQLVEYLLLSDVVWVCDTVTQGTMQETLRYYDLFVKHGLAGARSDGHIRIAKFTSDQILAAVRSATPLIKHTVTRYGASDFLRLSSNSAYFTRPTGAQPADFQSLAALEYGSAQADEYIRTGLEEQGWKTAALAPLLDPSLHLWLTGLVATFPDPASPVYCTLNTVFRWRYNEQLALLLKQPDGHTVDYVPAMGRAKSIEHLAESSWFAKLRRFQQGVTTAVDDADVWRQKFEGFGATLNYPLPLIGAWAVSQLKPKASLDDLIEKIRELKDSQAVLALKKWLTDTASSPAGFSDDLRKSLSDLPIPLPSNKGSGKLLKRPNPLIWSDNREDESSVTLGAASSERSLDPVYMVSTILNSMSETTANAAADIVLERVTELLGDSTCRIHSPRALLNTRSAAPAPTTTSSRAVCIFRRKGEVWEIGYRDAEAGHYPHRKGFKYLQTLIHAKGRLLSGAELLGRLSVQSGLPSNRRRLSYLKWQLRQEQQNITLVDEAIDQSGDALSLSEREHLMDTKSAIRQRIEELQSSLQSLDDFNDTDPNRAAAHAVRVAITRALTLLRARVPDLAAHLDHCRSVNGNCFRYDPGSAPPVWELD